MKNTSKNIVISALLIGLGLVLPFITGNIPHFGSMLLPMHIPVLLAGFILGPKYGLLIGLIIPGLRSTIIGMPPIFPFALVMTFELGAYGFCTGYFYNKFKVKPYGTYLSLLIAMVLGRFVWGIIASIVYPLAGIDFGLKLFLAGAYINALPGIIFQLLTIPLIVKAMKK